MAGGYIQITEGAGKKLATGTAYTESSNSVQDEKVILGEQYLAGYAVAATLVSLTTANSHLLQIMAGSSLKVRIRRIIVSLVAFATVPASAGLADLRLYRLSSAGTGGSSITPSPQEAADGASGATAMTLPSAKGTEGVLLCAGSLGAQAAGAEPVAAPLVWDFDFLRIKPPTIAAGTANGVAIKNITALAGTTVNITVWFDEAAF